jgi:HlyD family secretion protein
LQSGMSLTANIKIRDRTVMSLFTDFFVTNTEKLKFVR